MVSKKVKENKNNLKTVKLIFFFLLSYAIMYFLGIVTDLMNWPEFNPLQTDYMIFLLPIAGFFFSYILIDWFDSFFEKKLGSSLWYPVILTVTGIIAYYISLWFYFQNNADLGGSGVFDFGKIFIESHYIYFLIAALLAWASKKIIDYTE